MDNVLTFLGLQLDKDPNSTPEGYTPGADCVPLMTAVTTDGVTVNDSGNLEPGVMKAGEPSTITATRAGAWLQHQASCQLH